jgi:polysaccharide biosynthesis transport protein
MRPSTNAMQADQLRKLTRKWAIPIIVVTILGAAASYVVSKRLTPTYAAVGKVLVVVGPGQAGGSGGLNISATEATTTAASLITEPTLLQQVISQLHLNTTPSTLAKEVTAVAESNTELVDVTLNDPSPTRAAQIANVLMTAYVAQVRQANRQQITQAAADIQSQINAAHAQLIHDEQLAAGSGQASAAARSAIPTDTTILSQLQASLAAFEATQAQALNAVSVAEPAAIPTKPASPNVLLNTIAGALLALLLAAGAAYLIEFFDQGLKSPEDVRDRLGLPCLAAIPKFRRIPKGGKPIATNRRHDEAVKEAYRRLRINLLFSAPDTDLKGIVITSVRPGEGKTCTAANLAVALASSERHVLLIDADLRKPDQHRLFGTTLEGGLSELILKTPTAARVALNGFRPTQFANLSLLTSGTVPPNPSELLASKRASAVLDAIGPEQDLIVIDTAPAGLVSDPLSIAASASATILVVEAGKTKASQAAATIETLREVGANVIGVVLNKASHRLGYGYGYKSGYPSYSSGKPDANDVATSDDVMTPDPQPQRRADLGVAAQAEPRL